jgi:hypothetical protein
MITAILVATAQSGSKVGAIMPAQASGGDLPLKLLPCALLAALPLVLSTSTAATEVYASLWAGAMLGLGVSIGGMVRPAVVMKALSPAEFDPTLWVLFCTALAVTFGFYRVAQARGNKDARADNSKAAIDTKLVSGAVMFGTGWAMTGLCPGPLLVCLGATPFSPGLLVVLGAVCVGIKLSQQMYA